MARVPLSLCRLRGVWLHDTLLTCAWFTDFPPLGFFWANVMNIPGTVCGGLNRPPEGARAQCLRLVRSLRLGQAPLAEGRACDAGVQVGCEAL